MGEDLLEVKVVAIPEEGNCHVFQLCGRPDHVAMKCFHRFDVTWHDANQDQSKSTESSPQGQNRSNISPHAYVANNDDQQDNQEWYLDSEATSHVTADLQNPHL